MTRTAVRLLIQTTAIETVVGGFIQQFVEWACDGLKWSWVQVVAMVRWLTGRELTLEEVDE